MNRKFFSTISALTFLFISATAVAKTSNSDQVNPKKADSTQKKHEVKVSSPFNRPIIVRGFQPQISFSLESNPSSGYSWFLSSYDSNLIVPLTQRYITPKKSLMGAPGTSFWAFRVRENAFIVPTITRVAMTYGRPWDLSDSKTRVITIIALP